ncbi:hypothetical protein Avbf_00928 [Armadillidium vulgare]|nr:hypothetical protein Avbf_00928 [Armadillidium vulgare]
MDTPKKLMLQIHPLNGALCVFQGAHLIFRKGKDVPWIYQNVNWEPLQVPRVTEKETKTILKHSGWHLTCKFSKVTLYGKLWDFISRVDNIENHS